MSSSSSSSSTTTTTTTTTTTARQNQGRFDFWADRARRRMEAFCTNEKDDDDDDDDENDGKQNDEKDVDAFLERHDAEASSRASQSPENQNQDQDENNEDDAGKSDAAAVVGSALRLAHAHVRFLKFFSFAKEEEDEEEKEEEGEEGRASSQCGRRQSMVLKRRTLSAHALGSLLLNVGRVLNDKYDTASSLSSILNDIEDDEGDVECVSVSLAKEILADALAMLKKNSASNSNTNNSDRILEQKQWYVACIVRAIKACAMLTSWPEREMDALVNVLLRECAFHKYEGRRGGDNEGNVNDEYIDGFSEENDWCLPSPGALASREARPVELLKIEALAALGYMAKRNPSGMCSRWQMVFPREFSPATKKKSSSLLASQKTLEKLMVFERSASVRSAACFAIISLLDSSEAKKYLAMAEMKEENRDMNASSNAAIAISSMSSRRSSSGFSTVSMYLGENAVALCETISYAWVRLSEHDTRRRFPGAPIPSKETITSADKWINWLTVLTEKAVESFPFLRLPKRLVPQLSNAIRSALLIEYSSFPSSAVMTAFYKETPIIRCLGITLSAKFGFESLGSTSSAFKACLNARIYAEEEMSLFLQACEALWIKAGASITRDSLIDKEVQESCEAFKALQKLASSENASKLLFPYRECVCKLSPDVLMAMFFAKSSSRASKVACEKIIHASVKLQCAMLASVLQKRGKNITSECSEFFFCADIRRELWWNFIDKALPSCLSNSRSDEVTQLVKIAALRCLSETTEWVIADIMQSSSGSSAFARIKSVFEAPLEILQERHRRYPSATRAEAMRTLASLLILDPKYFAMKEVLLGALESVKKDMNQESAHQDCSKTLEMNASSCAANIALCVSRLPPPLDESKDDDAYSSIKKELTHLFHSWTILKGDKVRANVARGLGHIAKFRDLDDETLQLICDALFSCVSTGSAKTQWNSCVAIKILFENQGAITSKVFSSNRGGNNAGIILTRLLLTLIKTSENFKIRRESLAAISRVSRSFLNKFSYIDCTRVVVEALVQSGKQCKVGRELEDDHSNATKCLASENAGVSAAERYLKELKVQATSTFVHLLSIGDVSEIGCSKILSEHSSQLLEAIEGTTAVMEDGSGFENATKFDKEAVSKAQTVLREILGQKSTPPVLIVKNENVSKQMHK
jgi:hypothetical protein